MKHINKQKIIICFIGFVTLTFLFPPFQSFHAAGGISNSGYSFILLPPKGTFLASVVNTEMLLIEWSFALIIGASAWILLKVRNAKSL